MTYFTRFQPHHIIELRAIKGAHCKRAWLLPHDLPKNEEVMKRLNGWGYDIYAGVNPRDGMKSDEAGVSEIVALHVDIDGSGKPATMEREPSLVIDSGHGCHLYWLLNEPVPPSAIVRDINRGLALSVGGDPHCCDLARILRVPGYVNHKEPKRTVSVLESNDLRYTLDDFRHLAVAAPYSTGVNGIIEGAPLDTALSIRFFAWLQCDPDGEAAWKGEVGDGSSDSRFILVKRMVASGFTNEEVVSIVASKEWRNRRTGAVRVGEDVKLDAGRLAMKARASMSVVGTGPPLRITV